MTHSSHSLLRDATKWPISICIGPTRPRQPHSTCDAKARCPAPCCTACGESIGHERVTLTLSLLRFRGDLEQPALRGNQQPDEIETLRPSRRRMLSLRRWSADGLDWTPNIASTPEDSQGRSQIKRKIIMLEPRAAWTAGVAHNPPLDRQANWHQCLTECQRVDLLLHGKHVTLEIRA